MTALAASPITPKDIHERCVGLEVWFRAAADSADHYNDDTIARNIPALIRDFEREAQFRINPVQVVSNPDGTYDGGVLTDPFTGGSVAANKEATMPLLVESPSPYYVEQGWEYFRVTHRERPVIQVQRMRVMWSPTDLIFSFPPTWIRTDTKAGRSWLFPIAGQALVGQAAIAYQVFTSSFGARSYAPAVVAIDYQVGLAPGWQNGYEWADLKRCLTSYVAAGILDDICELFDAGLISAPSSVAGASLQVNYERFVRKRQELRAQAARFMQILTDQETPFMLGGL